ncbi:AGR096Cp [Eremothecium gossypii ATCC 10895]|uniref:AGR096Cp n=1 Tax=Eremothecium gossypii (strain ATCC 10895 / CBS 109.51 / FGSC 9923 / NRRL Y-1056) TaxID=284811 RepID=Q74ZV3_EREGS|nr:AGR096Cp [Eremothecium gossypii ATCC 10895]AAS54585.2 AGR096Cp [Eremothecium gossypii ATCC 10895]
MLSYETYMNLVHYPEHWSQPVPHEISRRVICNALSPCVSVQSTAALEAHLAEEFSEGSLYMLLRYFADYVRERGEEVGSVSGQRRPGSVYQRQTSRYVRFQRPLEEVIETAEQQAVDFEDLEEALGQFLRDIEARTTNESPSELLKHSIFHKFITMLSSTALSPYHTVNHPIMALLALDVTQGEEYTLARELLVQFKNLPSKSSKFPSYINTNDVLPVFILCFDESSSEQWETVQALQKAIKKQLFVESVPLPIFTNYESDPVVLHPPITNSLQEQVYDGSHPPLLRLCPQLVDVIYETINAMVEDLMIPFMNRKISFWDETILQPRKSIFHGNKFLKRFMNKTNSSAAGTLSTSSDGYFLASSNEFLLRKLADWSFMLSDYKTAYSIYYILLRDFELYPQYLSSCQEFSALSLLMGAHSIVTTKMIKNDIDPLIMKYMDSTVASLNYLGKFRCLVYMAELFLSLSDTWTSAPFAIKYLELILQNEQLKLGPLSRTMLWERISYAYQLRIDPRIHTDDEYLSDNFMELTTEDDFCMNPNKLHHWRIHSLGLTRHRKEAVFRLLAAKKWLEYGHIRQGAWSLKGCNKVYRNLGFANADGTLLSRLVDMVVHEETVQSLAEHRNH